MQKKKKKRRSPLAPKIGRPPAPKAMDAAKFRELRELTGLSLSQVASRIGIAKSSMHKLEHGETVVTFDHLRAFRHVALDEAKRVEAQLETLKETGYAVDIAIAAEVKA